MFRIGIIGCGKIAQVRHIPEYDQNPDVQLYGFYDLSADRTGALAEKFGARAYDTIDDMLADPMIDAVSVCTANAFHADNAVAALRAGKHVLCEKPMAITMQDCEKMVQEAAQAGKILMIDQNQRLARAHVEAKKMIDTGEIGKVLSFRTTFGHGGPETWSINPGKGTWFFDRKQAAMGAMADLGIHKTDLIQYLLSQTVTETTARLSTLDKTDAEGNLIGVDDNAFCIYKMSGGTIGTMTASWTYYGTEDNSTVLYGTEGILRIYDDPVHSIVIIRKDGTRSEYDVEQIQTNDNQTKSGVIDLFVESLKKGKALGLTAESVLSAMKAVFASLESAETGRTVVIG
jgi:predicted dehydrogenase